MQDADLDAERLKAAIKEVRGSRNKPRPAQEAINKERKEEAKPTRKEPKPETEAVTTGGASANFFSSSKRNANNGEGVVVEGVMPVVDPSSPPHPPL